MFNWFDKNLTDWQLYRGERSLESYLIYIEIGLLYYKFKKQWIKGKTKILNINKVRSPHPKKSLKKFGLPFRVNKLNKLR